MFISNAFSRLLKSIITYALKRVGGLGVISSIISRVCDPSHVLGDPISRGEPLTLRFVFVIARSRFAFTGKLKAKIVQTCTKGEVKPDTLLRSSAFISVNVFAILKC